MFFQSRSHSIFTLRPPLKDRLNPSLFLYIHSIMHMSYRFDHMCCSILIYGGDGFLQTLKDRDTNLTTFDSSATKYCLALGKCSRNIFGIIMNEEKGKKKKPMNAHFSGQCLFIKNVDSGIKYTRVLLWFLTGKYVTLAGCSVCFFYSYVKDR